MRPVEKLNRRAQDGTANAGFIGSGLRLHPPDRVWEAACRLSYDPEARTRPWVPLLARGAPTVGKLDAERRSRPLYREWIDNNRERMSGMNEAEMVAASFAGACGSITGRQLRLPIGTPRSRDAAGRRGGHASTANAWATASGPRSRARSGCSSADRGPRAAASARFCGFFSSTCSSAGRFGSCWEGGNESPPDRSSQLTMSRSRGRFSDAPQSLINGTSSSPWAVFVHCSLAKADRVVRKRPRLTDSRSFPRPLRLIGGPVQLLRRDFLPRCSRLTTVCAPVVAPKNRVHHLPAALAGATSRAEAPIVSGATRNRA